MTRDYLTSAEVLALHELLIQRVGAQRKQCAPTKITRQNPLRPFEIDRGSEMWIRATQERMFPA